MRQEIGQRSEKESRFLNERTTYATIGSVKSPAQIYPVVLLFRSATGFPPTFLLSELAGVEVEKGLPDLLLSVHHERTMADYWFLEGFSGDEEEPDTAFARADRDRIAVPEDH